LRLFVGKRVRLPLVGGAFVGVSGRVPRFHEHDQRVVFRVVFLLTLLAILTWCFL
jgi:hypothetical protein